MFGSDSFLTELGVNPRISWVSDQSLFSEPVFGVAIDTVETTADKPDFVVEANLSPYTLPGLSPRKSHLRSYWWEHFL